MPRRLNTASDRHGPATGKPWRFELDLPGWAACAALIAVLIALGNTAEASARVGTARLCDLAARKASEVWKVPLDVLQAISRAETGRTVKSELHPWPWTVNMEGKGEWFTNQDDARAYVFKHFKRGARSFDVGCFQINYKWHGTAFRSIDDMFDPQLNADYAARFLRDLYAEFGDWTAAAGAYHSRTKTHAGRYSARFEKIRTALTSLDDQNGPVDDSPAPRTPGRSRDIFSIALQGPLIGEGTGRMGSLVPIGQARNVTGRAFVAMN